MILKALDQWLLADLRDLDFPVLPEGIARSHKTELNGTFCVQVEAYCPYNKNYLTYKIPIYL